MQSLGSISSNEMGKLILSLSSLSLSFLICEMGQQDPWRCSGRGWGVRCRGGGCEEADSRHPLSFPHATTASQPTQSLLDLRWRICTEDFLCEKVSLASENYRVGSL